MNGGLDIKDDVTYQRQKRAYLEELSNMGTEMTGDEKLVKLFATSQALMLDYVQVGYLLYKITIVYLVSI